MNQRVSARRTTSGSARHHAAAALFALLVLLILALATATLRPAHADPEAATVVANQLRRQGFKCDEPAKAERDVKASVPHEAVWTLQCKNASYRVRLIPKSAAKVEPLKN